MIKVFGYLKRKPGLSPQEFADYYEHNHLPLVLSKAFMPMVYKRNYIQRGDAFNIEGNEISFDCMTELIFADRDDLSAWMASLGVYEIAQDEENFIDRAATRAYVVDERLNAIRPEHPCHRLRGFQVRRWPPSVNLWRRSRQAAARAAMPSPGVSARRGAWQTRLPTTLNPGVPVGDASTTKPASNPARFTVKLANIENVSKQTASNTAQPISPRPGET